MPSSSISASPRAGAIVGTPGMEPVSREEVLGAGVGLTFRAELPGRVVVFPVGFRPTVSFQPSTRQRIGTGVPLFSGALVPRG